MSIVTVWHNVYSLYILTILSTIYYKPELRFGLYMLSLTIVMIVMRAHHYSLGIEDLGCYLGHHLLTMVYYWTTIGFVFPAADMMLYLGYGIATTIYVIAVLWEIFTKHIACEVRME